MEDCNLFIFILRLSEVFIFALVVPSSGSLLVRTSQMYSCETKIFKWDFWWDKWVPATVVLFSQSDSYLQIREVNQKTLIFNICNYLKCSIYRKDFANQLIWNRIQTTFCAPNIYTWSFEMGCNHCVILLHPRTHTRFSCAIPDSYFSQGS